MTSSWAHINWPRTIVLMVCVLIALLAVLQWLRNMRPAQREKLGSYLKRNVQELVGLPLAFILFWLSGQLLRWVDPTSAVFDPAVLQTITIAMCQLIVGHSLARVGANLNEATFNNNHTPINKEWLYVIYLGIYSLLVAAV